MKRPPPAEPEETFHRVLYPHTGNAASPGQVQQLLVEGGADRLQELRERVASVSPSNALRDGVVVAENRAEFGSKYQRY